ncbi:EboA domain-containing protein [Chitinophaga sp.]|mgnify:CR=1 FL=1|uniref:EboA domain-containing protein n=1 Tax=Chitinophaga sp. TaxID=1869181 RepID=UPI002614DBD0|nr:EboA domain-containing protein [uncultured Chitinophaga sp.]
MGYAYEAPGTSAVLADIIQQQISEKGRQWIAAQLEAWQSKGTLQTFNIAFTAAPRFLGRDEISVPPAAREALLPRSADGYTADRLFRVWWLLQLPVNDEAAYVQAIENLFNAGEMNELTALYGALPFLAFPEAWKLRTAEGVRSNIGSVLEAIMVRNPYPAQYLEEPAWNQLVMKAFFTDKPVHLITGLDERANPELARILRDFSRERRAAARPVPPMLWRLVGPFLNEDNFEDLERAWFSEVHAEREAAALACHSSAYPPASKLLESRAGMAAEIQQGLLTWETVAARVNGQ